MIIVYGHLQIITTKIHDKRDYDVKSHVDDDNQDNIYVL
jgi:hypothetical protein